jgi:Tfp pilus assembly protein PilZ
LFLRSRQETQEYLSLVAEVDSIVTRRGASGGKIAENDAVRLKVIEGRLVQLVTQSDEMDETRKGMRLFCDLGVRVRSKGKESSAVVADIGNGGVFIGTDFDAAEGEEVTLILSRAWPHFRNGETLKGKVAWVAKREDDRRGVGVAFAEMDMQAETSLRLQIIDLVRTHVHVWTSSARATAN